MAYHVMSAGYDAFTPVGATVGGILYGIRWRPFPSIFAMMGTGGLIGGSLGTFQHHDEVVSCARCCVLNDGMYYWFVWDLSWTLFDDAVVLSGMMPLFFSVLLCYII